MVITRACAALALGAAFMVVTGCETKSDTDSEGGRSDEPALIVRHDADQGGMYGMVRGTLAVNDRDCFAVKEHVLVVAKGSQVVDHGSAVETEALGKVKVGARVVSGGGYIEGAGDVTVFAEATDLVDEIMGCQPDPEHPAIAVLHPAG